MKKVYVVGIGPGSYEQMTIKAVRTLELSDIIVGYTVYVDLIREYFPGKELFSTPMMRRWTGAESIGVCSGGKGRVSDLQRR